MANTTLLLTLILIWIVVVTGLYRRVVLMPKWFAIPPASFNLIRDYNRSSVFYRIPVSVAFVVSVTGAIFLNWNNYPVRDNLFAGIVCYVCSGILNVIYFMPEIRSFIKIDEKTLVSNELLSRTRYWLRWTGLRNLLQITAAIFITIAFSLYLRS